LQLAIYDAVHDGLLRITDPSGISVAVTEASQVNLSSAGLRLVGSQYALNARAEGVSVNDGRETAPGPGLYTSGSTSRGGSTSAPLRTEKFVTFPLVGNLLDSEAKAEALASLFRLLYTVLDEHRVSYAQGTLQFVLEAQSAEKVAAEARALGLNVSVRDQ
jgi:hypothetical protein